MEGGSTVNWVTRLNNIGPWVLSLLAILQVWALEAWKRFQSGRIEIHANQIEIGYGVLGPVVSVFGTLRCLRDDVFIQEVRAELIRESDNAKHSFTWFALRPSKIFLTGEQQEELEMATAFQVNKDESQRFGFLFHEEEFQEEYHPMLESLKNDWNTYYRTRSEQIIEEANEQEQQIANYSALSQNIFQEFINNGYTNEVFDELNRACYWEHGGYRIIIEVDTPSQEEAFKKEYRFELSRGDAEGMRDNAMVAIRETCNQTHNYQFAYPSLEEVEE